MKAIGLFEYGGPEVLRVIELPEPHAGSGQVRIRVSAAGINPADVMLREGLLRLSYLGMEPPFVPGMDVAETIDEMGEGVERFGFSIGDAVSAIVNNSGHQGGYSEYVVLPAASVARMPSKATFAEAASFLMNALTARTALDTLALQPGATLAVTGGAGAFGGYVIQLAAHEGFRVIANSTQADESLIRSFGATDVVPRGEGIAQRIRNLVTEGVDAVADGALLNEVIVQAIREGGQIILVRAWNGAPLHGITAHHINVRGRSTDTKAINQLRDQVDAGILGLRVAATYPADQVVEAHRRLAAGGVRGRIVLEF